MKNKPGKKGDPPENYKRKSVSFTFGLGRDRDYFIENVSTLVSSGMGVREALDAVRTDIRSGRMRAIIDDIREDVESGSPFWRALERTRLFAAHTISLVKIGEDSGRLSENLRVISLQEEKDRMFRSKIRSAMMYPVFVLSLTVIIGVGIAWFILPKLALVFAQLKLTLPLITKILISVGTFLGDHGVVAVPLGVLVFAVVLCLIFYFPKTKLVGQSILFILPGTKKLIQEVELARFGYLLGTLLRAGLPVTQALHSLSQATLFPHYKKFYENLTRSIEDGNSFKKSFIAYHHLNRLVPTPVQQLIATGEQSGNLPETLLRVGQTYEAKTETTTKNLAVILEPALLVIVWLGVVAVALAVILPIYNLIGGLSAGGQVAAEPPPQTETAQVPQAPVAEPATSSIIRTESSTIPIILKEQASQKLRILPTGFRYLNVRDAPSREGNIISKVAPGDTFAYDRIQDGWYEVLLPDGVVGWVAGKYVEILDR